MAEQVPYGVATSLINTLASAAFREIASIYGVKRDTKWLEKTVERIKAALADADKKQQNEQLIQLWIRDLKQVLYDADDLLDEIHTQHLLRHRDAKGKGKGKVREFFSSSNPIALRLQIAHKIRSIREQFNDVAESMSKLNLVGRVGEMKHEKTNWRETSSKLEQDMVGREEHAKEVIDLLLNTDNDENVSQVAVVGIGGLGKTALAQLVYSNAKANKLFDKQMWVCVSEEFDVIALVKKILESSIGDGVSDQQLDLLQNKLEQNLNGQKYLLVLDDVWTEDRGKWRRLKKYLMCGAKGSKILVTTRNQAVAEIMGVKTPYLLEGLNNDQSWTLLKRLAFDGDKIMTPNQEFVIQKIVKKCKGVPLAIRVMGGLLRSKSGEDDWADLLKDEFWNLHGESDSSDSIMPILKLSYDSLAIELKQCFAYCSLYPKDLIYNKDTLIDMWMAQGFLKNEDEKQCPEDVGEKYVRILLMKSFLQDVETDELGQIRYFKMHDLMHDLSRSVSSSDLYVEGGKNVARCPIHVSFKNYNSNSSLNVLDLGRLRTFREIADDHLERDPPNLFVFKRLRSLDLSLYAMRYLPESIGKMIHLRYLNLSYCWTLTCLPKSVSKLVNLQTLILHECDNLKFSGDIIIKLINLRQLGIKSCKALDDGMPIGLGKMTSMQNLSHFIVGNDNKNRKKAKLNELRDLNLRGRLAIKNLDLVRDVEKESKNVNLRAKKNLISLTLNWGDYPEMEKSDAMQLLENLRPHQNLKTLKIKTYPGVCLSDWLLSCTNLVKLELVEINNCQYLPALEGFVSLKALYIAQMDKLECIYYKGCSSPANFFRSLEQLRIVSCESLRGWQREANGQNTRDNEWNNPLPPFSRLSALTIWSCPNLSCMPTFPNLVRHLDLKHSSMKPLVDTLSVSTIGPSTSHYMTPSLSMLKSLFIEKSETEALPEEGMQNLFALEELIIGGLGHLTALPEWICHLQSLRNIRIFRCPNLKSFPAKMSCLTNLQLLELDATTRLLKEMCQRRLGAEWLKIRHIPNISIEGVECNSSLHASKADRFFFPKRRRPHRACSAH